jgi:hypothetical protein
VNLAATEHDPTLPPGGPASWRDLEREFDAWAAVGRTATLWWRDDDAVSATPELERLLALSGDFAVPLALAVIPAGADDGLRRRLAAAPSVVVLQHGLAHHNHAPPGDKKAEFGPHRPCAAMRAELAAGRERLRELFHGSCAAPLLPVLVPPWNRVDPALIPELPMLGLVGLSTHTPRPAREQDGVVQVNTHLDPLDWDGRRGRTVAPFVGTDAALGGLIWHLVARRTGRVDDEEPTGLLTHHLAMDAACWSFVAELLRRVAGHRAAHWVEARKAFGISGQGTPP